MAESPGQSDRDRKESSEGLGAVKRLAENTALRLSTEDRLSKRFHALIRIAFRTRDGARGTSYLVQRDDQRVGVLILSDEGLPFCYMSNGLLMTFNPTKPGNLLIHEGGNPSFALTSGAADERTSCDVAYASKGDQPQLLLDVSAILFACLNNATDARLHHDKSEIELKTERATISIELAPPNDRHRFPLKSLTMLGKAGDSLAAGPIGVDSEPTARLLGVDRAAVDKLKIPYKLLTAEDAAQLQVIVPPRFGADRRENEAAQQFLTLFARDTKGERETNQDDP